VVRDRLWLPATHSHEHTSIRLMRPDLTKRFEAQVGNGGAIISFFGEYSYVHKKSGRKVTEDMFPFHSPTPSKKGSSTPKTSGGRH